jgi:hypothetical protein
MTGFVTKNLLKVRKYYLFGKVKANMPDFDIKDISAAYDIITQTIEVTNEENGRVHVLRKSVQGSRSLDLLSAQGFTALIALLKHIQDKDGTIIQDDQIKEIINRWSKIFYEEIENQTKHWRAQSSWSKSIRRIFGIRSKSDQEDIYTNPRYHPATLINLYMWEQVKKIRNAVAQNSGIKDQVKESIDLLNNENQDDFRAWAQTKAKETVHPLVIGAARNLFLVYWIFIAAAFGRSELTYLQASLHYDLEHHWLVSLANHFIEFSSWGVLATGIISLLMAYMIPQPKAQKPLNLVKVLRGVLAFGGLALAGTWLMGIIGDYKINFLLPESLSISTGSQTIISTFVHKLTQQTILFLMIAASLISS